MDFVLNDLQMLIRQKTPDKQTYNVCYDIKLNKLTKFNHLTVCKQMADVKLNC